ncbi:LCI family antimicrobial peptide [Bacillus amyloliquefaciens]|nr:antimicrobial peptide LCI [Bacillus amyloliquefaciens]MCY7426601.1 antimicrobial peptide LCI [Bacillus amyloliquefaciens]MEC0963668.1 LCI family antimicrobial peptide [Bacillus amyloliquefaciens]MEC1013938.1 LCI family antimicrobial peptide [Bacillus amyloliquefaciens]MEC2261439.1 LCI family antimicrobial peptide [Bacillus amyloliquefaciens]
MILKLKLSLGIYLGTTGIFANTFDRDGIRWYLKGITKVSEGHWIGHYEGVRL